MKKKKLIHPPYNRFKGWLRSQRMVYENIADILCVSVPTISAKINGTSDFLLSEVKFLQKKYGLTDDIFFTEDVA